MNRLMLCAGKMRRDGWRTLDAKGGDFVATIPPLPLEVKAITWDEIEWVHGITSFYPWEAEQMLAELHGALTPGGKLTLEQPDFRKAIERVEWLFGDPVGHNPLHMNKWSYTPESLYAALAVAGFRRIEISKAQHHVPARDFRIEAMA